MCLSNNCAEASMGSVSFSGDCQALDGKVERDREGKEFRYPVILTAQEKEIARQVCLAFKVRIVWFR